MFYQKNDHEERLYLLTYKNHYCLTTNLYNFCKRKEKFTQLCRRCPNTYGSQPRPESHVTRCVEQEICNISNIGPDKTIEFLFLFMRKDPSNWIPGDSECKNVPVDDPQRKTLSINKPVALVDNIF